MTFQVGADQGVATTDDLGVARFTPPSLLAPGLNSAQIQFVGDAGDLPASLTATISVAQSTTRLRVSGKGLLGVGTAESVGAVLTDEDGAPVVGRTVSFISGPSSTSGSTNPEGSAIALLTLPGGTATGQKTLQASFAGDVCYSASSDQAAVLAYFPIPDRDSRRG